MKNLWLYLHFPHLQLDTLFSEKPVEHALIILDSKTNTVVQLNALARQAGICLRMGLGTAAALDQNLQVIPYQAEIERHKLSEIAESLYNVTCDISFFPPNGLLLRIHNMLNLYGGLSAYWYALKSQLSTLGLSYCYATGRSPFAARILARDSWNQITDECTVLKKRVGDCSLQQTELDPKTIQKLNRVGIHSVSNLLKLPLKDIAKRFDIDLVTYLGRLTGEFQHPVTFFHPAESFHRYLELLFDIENTQTLQHPLKHLLNALEQFLKVRDLLTQNLILTFKQRDHDELNLEIGSAQGEYQAEKWLALTALKLENLKLMAPVYAISLRTGETHVREPEKTDFFAGKKGTLSCLQLISLLQAKLGEQAIQGLVLHDDFRPELATGYASPLLQPAPQSSLQALRPSFLMHIPQALNEKVSIVHGPERLSTGWWDNKEVTRDYFIARSESGQWYWIYKTPDTRWYLHGIFG